jgi:hypothetical protein
MHHTRRLLVALGFAVLIAACGGTDTTDPAAADTAAAKGGKPGGGGGGSTSTSGGASVSATNGTYGGYTWVSFYPGSYATSQLYVGINCTQNGATVLAGSSWELHYAVSAGFASYKLVGDHYEVAFSPLMSQSYTGGSASCVVQGYVSGTKGLTSVASGAFSISG